MALERVAVLEEELELSNQEVGGVAERGGLGQRTKKLIDCVAKETSRWGGATERNPQGLRRAQSALVFCFF